ncbi:hypothetical protein C8R42DRAFT_643540 [Lentinula raphanica]|nr:hypothetical protein C8R42DRAFT_643540 [Lentinula raphanica]
MKSSAKTLKSPVKTLKSPVKTLKSPVKTLKSPIPIEDEQVPIEDVEEDEQVPIEDEQVPIEDEQVPIEDEQVPIEDDQVPSEEDEGVETPGKEAVEARGKEMVEAPRVPSVEAGAVMADVENGVEQLYIERRSSGSGTMEVTPEYSLAGTIAGSIKQSITAQTNTVTSITKIRTEYDGTLARQVFRYGKRNFCCERMMSVFANEQEYLKQDQPKVAMSPYENQTNNQGGISRLQPHYELQNKTSPSDLFLYRRTNPDPSTGIYPDSVQGLVIGTFSTYPTLVHIPVDAGVDDYQSIDDLDVRMYMWKSRKPSINSCCLNRFHVDHFPAQASSGLKHPYTFYFEESSSPAAFNKFIRDNILPYDFRPVPSLRGNVVIVKHTNGVIDDMTLQDWPLVEVILEWMTEHRWQFSDSCPNEIPKGKPPVKPLGDASSDIANPTSGIVTVSLQSLLDKLDLCWTIFEHTPVLSLFALGATCSNIRASVQAFYRGRVIHMMATVFEAGRHSQFLQVIDHFGSRIGGSLAYRVVDPTATFTPNDLNILTPFGKAERLCEELTSVWDCVLGPGLPRVNRAGPDFCPGDTYYLKSPLGFPITITESYDDSIVPLMLTGFTTAELYPTLVENGQVLRLPCEGRKIPDDFMATVRNRLDVLDSTDNLGRPCLECCPNVWRRTAGMRGSATMHWGGLTPGTDTKLKSGSYEWKTGDRCRNELCKWNGVEALEMSRWRWWENDKQDVTSRDKLEDDSFDDDDLESSDHVDSDEE